MSKDFKKFVGKTVRIIFKDGSIYKGMLTNSIKCDSYILENNTVNIVNIDNINEIPKYELNTQLIIQKNKDSIIKTFDEATSFIRLIDKQEYDNSDLVSKIPLATNCAFACELYLKVLLLNRGFTADDVTCLNHNLKKLYINLLEKDKNEIDKWIKVFVQEDVWDILDEIKNTFTDLRYNFIKEKVKDINMKKLLEFTFKIQNVASFEIVGYDVYRFPKGKPTKKDEDEYLDNFVRKNFMINKN